MEETGWKWTHEATLPSDLAAGRVVVDEILEQLQNMGWSDEDVFSIHMAAEEALVNAVKHGNKDNPAKFVDLACRLSNDEAHIFIRDEGCGFDPGELPDPTAPENLERPGGRGVLLIRKFMSHVEYNDCGNEITMVKHRGDGLTH